MLRPFIGGPAVLGHVRPHAGGDVVVDGAELIDLRRRACVMIAALRSISPCGVAEFRGPLQRALMYSARSPSKRRVGIPASLSVFGVMTPAYQ